MELVLSLFPGADLLGMAFELEGYSVVCGPDIIFGRDVRKFHVPPGRFDGVIGGPPCQAFSRLRHIVEHNGYEVAPNLIPEFERLVYEAQPTWFLMENVPAAPEPKVEEFKVCRRMVKDCAVGGNTLRLRAFSFGTRDGRSLPIDVVALENSAIEPSVLASGGRPIPLKIGGNGKPKRTTGIPLGCYGYRNKRSILESARAQGLESWSCDDLTIRAQQMVLGNGVPIAMGRSVARGIREAIHGTSPTRKTKG